MYLRKVSNVLSAITSLKDPVLLIDCGHRLCKLCYESARYHATQQNPLQCPQCRHIIHIDKVVDDIGAGRLVMDLQVFCDNKSKGCVWCGELRHLKDHIDKQCSVTSLKKYMETVEARLNQKDTEMQELQAMLSLKNGEMKELRTMLSSKDEEVQRIRTNNENKFDAIVERLEVAEERLLKKEEELSLVKDQVDKQINVPYSKKFMVMAEAHINQKISELQELQTMLLSKDEEVQRIRTDNEKKFDAIVERLKLIEEQLLKKEEELSLVKDQVDKQIMLSSKDEEVLRISTDNENKFDAIVERLNLIEEQLMAKEEELALVKDHVDKQEVCFNQKDTEMHELQARFSLKDREMQALQSMLFSEDGEVQQIRADNGNKLDAIVQHLKVVEKQVLEKEEKLALVKDHIVKQISVTVKQINVTLKKFTVMVQEGFNQRDTKMQELQGRLSLKDGEMQRLQTMLFSKEEEVRRIKTSCEKSFYAILKRLKVAEEQFLEKGKVLALLRYEVSGLLARGGKHRKWKSRSVTIGKAKIKPKENQKIGDVNMDYSSSSEGESVETV